eukprot:67785_1
MFISLVIICFSLTKSQNICDNSNTECNAVYINPNLTISEQQRQSFETNGFLIVRNALSIDQVELWRKLIDPSVDSRGIDHIFPQKGQWTPEENLNLFNAFTQRINLWQNDEQVCKLIGSAGYTIGRIASELEGIDGVQLHHDQALYKPPFGNPTAFHVDVPYWTFSSIHAVSSWIALDKVTKQNGCMYYIAGSHSTIANKTDPFLNAKIGENVNAIFKEVYPEFLDEKYKCIAAEVNAGDIIFFNGLIVHGAAPNFSNKRRRAMTLGMFPIGAVFNGKKNILTDEQFEKMKVGDPLNDMNQNPILYSKQKIVDNHKCFVCC